MSEYPLIAVVGPTGSGKSSLALDIAVEFDGEIVNCDSLQLYKHFDIGTAKTPPEERRGIPHHLLDVLEPGQISTAGDYASAARQVIRAIAGRGKLPVVVGGTGFYWKALLDGLFDGPARNDALRARLKEAEARRPGLLHRLLTRWDPPTAARVHPHDKNKLIRTLEIRLVARRPLDALFAAGRQPLTGFRAMRLGLDPPRAELYRVLDARCERMWTAGLLEEVTSILNSGYSRAIKPLEAIGYREALQALEGGLIESEALSRMKLVTRRYAKRQWTWFRKDPQVIWLQGFGSDPEVRARALALAALHAGSVRGR